MQSLAEEKNWTVLIQLGSCFWQLCRGEAWFLSCVFWGFFFVYFFLCSGNFCAAMGWGVGNSYQQLHRNLSVQRWPRFDVKAIRQSTAVYWHFVNMRLFDQIKYLNHVLMCDTIWVHILHIANISVYPGSLEKKISYIRGDLVPPT